MKGFFCLLMGMAFILTSCKDSTTSSTVYDNLNSPVSTNVANSFTYTINANQYSQTSYHDLNFPSDSLVITLTSSTHLSGQAIISVRDSSGTTIFSDTVTTNKTVVIAQIKKSRPKQCFLGFTALTAKLVFVVVGR